MNDKCYTIWVKICCYLSFQAGAFDLRSTAVHDLDILITELWINCRKSKAMLSTLELKRFAFLCATFIVSSLWCLLLENGFIFVYTYSCKPSNIVWLNILLEAQDQNHRIFLWLEIFSIVYGGHWERQRFKECLLVLGRESVWWTHFKDEIWHN